MLALAPALLALSAASAFAVNVQLSERQSSSGLPPACEPKCTSFNAYYAACRANETSSECLAVCTPSEWGPYQSCLNCVEVEEPGVSFNSTMQKVVQRCIDNGRGDPTEGKGVTSLAKPKNETGGANATAHGGAGAASGGPSASSPAASPSASPNSGASTSFALSAAGVVGAVVAGATLLL